MLDVIKTALLSTIALTMLVYVLYKFVLRPSKMFKELGVLLSMSDIKAENEKALKILRSRIPDYSSPYIRRRDDNEILDAIRSKGCVLVVGREGSGKTRSVFEALKHMARSGEIKGRLLLLKCDRSVNRVPIFRWIGTLVLFLDDVDKYLKSLVNVENIISKLRRAGGKLLVVATCDESELQHLKRTGVYQALFRDSVVRLGDLSERDGKRLAETLQVYFDPEVFDGTPASIALNLRDKRAVYEGLDEQQKAILWSIKLLRAGYTFFPNPHLVQSVRKNVLGLEGEWEEDLKHLVECGFVQTIDGALHCPDIYLSRVVTDYPDSDEELVEDLRNLRKLLFGMGNSEGIYRLGNSFLSRRLRRDAVECFVQSGTSYVNNGQFEDALKVLSKAVELDPKHAKARCNRGIVHLFSGSLEEAIKDLSAAIELDRTHVSAYYNRGVAWARMGKLDRAIRDLETAWRLRGRSQDEGVYAAFALTRIYLEGKKDLDRAEEWLRRAEELREHLGDREKIMLKFLAKSLKEKKKKSKK